MFRPSLLTRMGTEPISTDKHQFFKHKSARPASLSRAMPRCASLPAHCTPHPPTHIRPARRSTTVPVSDSPWLHGRGFHPIRPFLQPSAGAVHACVYTSTSTDIVLTDLMVHPNASPASPYAVFVVKHLRNSNQCNSCPSCVPILLSYSAFLTLLS
jgi:hypothetical protein